MRHGGAGRGSVVVKNQNIFDAFLLFQRLVAREISFKDGKDFLFHHISQRARMVRSDDEFLKTYAGHFFVRSFGKRNGADLARSQNRKDRKSTRLNSSHSSISYALFFFNDTATTEIYTLSLHDALPIS